MATSAKKTVGAADASSSSDDEQLKRCQEAVWETHTDKRKGEGGDSNVKSKRVIVDDHEHDGNELHVTQGFRTHVAKKLGHLLDSYITELQAKTSSRVESANCDDADDEGFRLFSTSVPRKVAEAPPAPVRRRPVPSSSDSDSEMETRLREAAVSIKDLLPSSAQPYTHSPTSTESPCSEITRKKQKNTQTQSEEEEERCVVKKKKKKRKPNREEGEKVDSPGSSLSCQTNGEQQSEQNHTRVKVKRKKKKKQKENAEIEA